ncbi:hypothetical protein [Nitrosomonas ureae]|uniref:Uncharacterized protein n=1 Tax=Nitrosomonas ureae TaxID=44577 RepID=A0A286AL30_9PROT|nr:hypothetical protein [Nitrosomonas ureae]SOD22618.1 hypothetical protein SAMN06297164_3529 [Nitrosomonas ureae]
MATEIEVAKYQFQSWARRGIAAQINELDTLGNPAATLPVNERASVSIGVSINGSPETPKNFALIGPGDIIGLVREQVVRTEPRIGISNFEPNYLAFIEFYDEDLLWRFTPAKPDGERLRPWLFLMVLKKSELERDDQRLPLPAVTIKTKEALPPSDETWLFAHVHTEQDIGASELSDLEKYLKDLQKEITTDPDKIYCRLLSPRHLEPNQDYHAFLVPTFEVGRLAGLGLPTKGIPAQKPAWDVTTTSVELPFYYAWQFNTGEKADFESLVELLEPRILDTKVGIRSMDCSHPGFLQVDNKGIAKPGNPPLPAANPIIQGLEGALKTADTKSLPLPEDFAPNAFQDEMQILVNLPETIQADFSASAGSDEDFLNDPVVTAPFYGQNHARQHKTDKVLLDISKSGWYHDLNRDPRTRVPAGFGTGVIQKNQEKFVQRAWQQVQKVYEGNRKIRFFLFFMEVSKNYSTQFFTQLAPAQLMALTSPIHAKIMGSPTTIRQQLIESRLKAPVFSPAFRRLVRPAGKLAQRLGAEGRPFDYSGLITELNEGRITPAPPRGVPDGIPSVDDLAKAIQPRSFPGWLRWLMRNSFWVFLTILFLLFLGGILTGAWALVGSLTFVAFIGYQWLSNQSNRADGADALTDPVKGQAALTSTPPQPTFNVELEGETARPPATPGATVGDDSVEARNFRRAAGELQDRLAVRIPEKPPLQAFDIANGHAKIARAIHPYVAYPLRLSALVFLPNLSFSKPEEIVDAMAHPDFEEAMYAYLIDINKELLIPNLHLIPPNTISLLETNPKFIESYMVGLNHEMGRELLWREYPTDLRGSYFRQFWEPEVVSNPNTPANSEQLKDITKIHTWQPTSILGIHKPERLYVDVQPGEKQLVLVIRGELIKRYNNIVIYAQKALDDGKGNKVIKISDLTTEEYTKQIKFSRPITKTIDPDLKFYSFDLTTKKALGEIESHDFPNDKNGWFFVILEAPGEPRFGMDISYEMVQDTDDDPTNNPADTWDNLAWNLFGASEPAFVKRSPTPRWPRPSKPGVRNEDLENPQHQWGTSSAQMAYALFQTPVMVAVHATEMLPPELLPKE